MTLSRRAFLSSAALIGASAALPSAVHGAMAKAGPAATGPIPLPPGISKTKFLQAVREFGRVVGSENVIVDADRLVSYSKIMIPDDDAQHEPAGAIMATSVEQVQGVLAVCNKYSIPIWTISTGRNYGYGFRRARDTGADGPRPQAHEPDSRGRPGYVYGPRRTRCDVSSASGLHHRTRSAVVAELSITGTDRRAARKHDGSGGRLQPLP